MSVKITWFGHAAFLIDTGVSKILIDPFISGNSMASVNPSDIKADYIFVTHGHSDHVGNTIDIANRNDSVVVSNPELCSYLTLKDTLKIHTMQIGGSFKFPWGTVKMVYAGHSSSNPDGGYAGNPAGFVFKINGFSIYHAGDTGLFGDMALLQNEKIDLSSLPIGDNYTMGPSDAKIALALIKSKMVVPMHYNTFPVIIQDAEKWVKEVNASGISKAVLLKVNESLTL